jgi:hypothetical protein
VQARLGPGEIFTTLTNFPRLGCPDFTSPATAANPQGPVTKSLFFPDEAINFHPRFATLTANIRERRGSKVAINLPVFHDTATPRPFVEEFPDAQGSEGAAAALPDHVYMDAMGFGMGCCCLQVTFQATNIDEARLLYDQLVPIVEEVAGPGLSRRLIPSLPPRRRSSLPSPWLCPRHRRFIVGCLQTATAAGASVDLPALCAAGP